MENRKTTILFLLLALGICQVLTTQEKLDPLKHRAARGRVDLNERKKLYREKIKSTRECPPSQPPSDPSELPKVPNSFTTDVEIAFQEFNVQTTIYGQEMYDGVKQRGVLNYQFAELINNSRPLVLAEQIIYNVKRDEALFIFTNAGCAVTGQEDCNSATNCTSGNLKDLNVELEYIFGVVTHTSDSGFVGASSILEFGPQYNYTQKMTQVCHGIDCHVYETCLFIPEENATLLYTYYWSTPEWNIVNSGGQVPIAVEIFGDKIDGHTTKEIMMRYDFFNYKREFRPSKFALEPNADIYCFSRKSEYYPPGSQEHFYQHSEIIRGIDIPIPVENVTYYARFRVIYPKTEYYDYVMRITRQDYLPIFAFGNEKRFENQTTLIHDFNQGLSYHVRQRQKYCRIGKIGNFSSDVEIGEDGSIFIQSPWHQEDLDMDLVYNGRHWERNIDSGVWNGIKSTADQPDETYVWYYASPLTNEITGFSGKIELPTLDHVPVKLEKYRTYNSKRAHINYNVYNYESMAPHIHNHDISLCYEKKDMMDLTFNMPENSLNKTRYLREHLKYAIVCTLADAGQVSPLRVNRLKIKKIKGALMVTFTLLEKPPITGDVDGAGNEFTLAEAYNSIKSKLDKSQLIVAVNLGPSSQHPDIVQLVAMPNTMNEILRDDGVIEGTESPPGYTKGAMAGLGITMTILGLLIGYLGIHVYTRK